MPIVNVQMFGGRDDTQKGFIARGIADVLAETTRTTKEGVHVTFDERSTANWAVGPRLWSTYTPPVAMIAAEPAAHVDVVTIRARAQRREDYLSWLRHEVYPSYAAFDGFLGSSLIETAEPDEFVLITKWWDTAARDAYLASETGQRLERARGEFIESEDAITGTIVDVWGAAER